MCIFFTLTDRASAKPSNICGCQSRTWSQKVRRSMGRIMMTTRYSIQYTQIRTKSLRGPATQEHRKFTRDVGLHGQEGVYVGMQRQQGIKNYDGRSYFLSGHPNTRPLKFPTDLAKVPAWRHRVMLFLNSHGLGYTVRQSTIPVNIISEDETIWPVDTLHRWWLTTKDLGHFCWRRQWMPHSNSACSTSVGAGVACHSGLGLAN